MFFKKENKVHKLLLRHFEAIEDSILHLNETIEAFLSGAGEKALILTKKVADDESNADVISKDISSQLYQGAYIPAIREDFLELVELFDDIADEAENVSDFIAYQTPEIPEQWRPQFRHLMTKTVEATEKLKDVFNLLFSNMRDAFEEAKRVKKMEDEIDEIKNELILDIFNSDLELAKKMHLRDFVIRIELISNTAENASDKIQAFTLKGLL